MTGRLQPGQDGIKYLTDTASGSSTPLSAWVISSGKTGHDVQSLGVVEALGVDPRIVSVAPRGLYRHLAPWGPAAPNPEFVPPWPDLAIGSSRQTVPYLRAVRKRSKGRTFTVVLQTPGISPKNFDLVWVPEHDRLRGQNVISTLTSPHRLTPERLAAAGEAWAPRLAHLKRPFVTVLIGGASGAYRFGLEEAGRLGADLRGFAQRSGASLLITASRRTGSDNMARLRESLGDVPAAVWEAGEENPYFGFMALADAFVVTCDSSNMIGEAAYTGQPVYAYELPGGSAKFARFHEGMISSGAMRWFDGALDRWDHPPLDATRTIAEAVRARMARR